MENTIDEYIDKIISVDVTETLKQIRSNSIDFIITSPPYYKQRDYGGFGIGNEKTVDEYINKLMGIFKECVRVVKNTGSIVFNVGDKYENGNLLLVPYKFAIEATKRTNVKLINEVTWVKLNPVPKQDKKKLVPSTEPFFIFVKSDNYYFDKDAYLNHIDFLKNSKKKKNGNNIGKGYLELIEHSDLSEEQKQLAKMESMKVIQDLEI